MKDEIKRCKYCGNFVPLDAMKRQRGITCGEPDCRRAQERVRKADYRARQKAGEVIPPPEPETPPVSILTPWGEFPCLCIAFVIAVLHSLDTYTVASAWVEANGYDGHHSLHCPAVAGWTLE